MILKRFFKWASIAFITLLVVTAILLFALDFGFLRGTIEERVRQATGLDLSIDDSLYIGFGSELVVQAQELHLVNTQWAEGESFVQIGQLNAVLNPWSLWKGHVVIKRMVLGDVDASLLQNTSGQADWQPFSTVGLELAFEGRLGTGEAFSGTDLSVRASGTELGRMFDIPGEVRLPGGPFTLNSRVQLDGARLKIGQLIINAGVFDFKLDAELPWPVDGSEGRFSLHTGGINISHVLPEPAWLTLFSGDYAISASGNWADGRISIQQGSFRMEKLQAQLGQGSIRGDFSFDSRPEVPVFDLSITTSALNLKPIQIDPAGADKSEDRGSARVTRLIPKLTFPMEALTRAEGHFAMFADRVYLQGVTLKNSALKGEVRNGGLKINKLSTDGYAGRLLATLALRPRGGGNAKLKMTVKSNGLVLDFTNQSEEEKQALPAFDIDIKLDGTGKSLREAAGALNGKITIASAGGRMSNVRGENTSTRLLAKLVSAISTGAARADEIYISCFAAALDARDGVLLLKPGIALQSDRLYLYAGGKIDLGSEKIDVNLHAETRNAIDLSVSELLSPYIKLSGTLANPSVALDPQGTLLSGSVAYLSGGLSVLAKKALDQLGGTEDPCNDILKTAAKDKNP